MKKVIDAEYLNRTKDFSEKTFGPGYRYRGILDHIKKEIKEIEADPSDLEEWVDIIILAFDGAWRSGADPQDIIDMIYYKQEKNEKRNWPDWRTVPLNKAIEHIKD